MKQKFKFYIVATVSKYSGEPTIFLSDTVFKDPAWPTLSEHEIEIDVPSEKDLALILASGLQEKITEMNAVSQAAVQEIREQISSLLALENLEGSGNE